jgi:serine/threonine protein kinase
LLKYIFLLFSEFEAQSIMKQLIMAYKEIYDMNIIHRDLKLSNILVQKGKIKLADFGFSITQDKYQHQGSSYNIGSPYYMPPETLKFNKYSFKSDIWALGVMAYEMVYGKLPWKEKI